jgi:hypothetical protein
MQKRRHQVSLLLPLQTSSGETNFLGIAWTQKTSSTIIILQEEEGEDEL